MTEAIYVDLNPGRIAYNAWREEFAPDWEDFDDLTGTAKAAWEDVAQKILDGGIRLPNNGVEVTFRTNRGLRGFAWTGSADSQMKDMVISLLWKAMSGELK